MSPEQRERLVAEPAGQTMTIGELSERTGVPGNPLRHRMTRTPRGSPGWRRNDR